MPQVLPVHASTARWHNSKPVVGWASRLSRRSLGLICLVLCCLPGRQAAALDFTPSEAPPPFTARELSRLEEGKVLLGIEELASNDILVKAYLIFEQPPAACWEIMRRTEEQPAYLKTITEIEPEVISPTQEHVEYEIRWLFIKKRFKLITSFQPDELYMYWFLDPAYDNDLAAHTGYWQLYPYAGGCTLAAYADNMAIAGLPRWLENLIKKQVVRMTMHDIKAFIDKQ